MGLALRYKRRPCAAFIADFPDDQIDNEAGTEIIVQGGRNVAKAIGQILRDIGCEVEEPRDAGDHGWDFAARGHGRECWCQITSLHPLFFLLFEDNRARGAPIGRGLSEALDQAMRADGRFRDLLWYTREHGPPEEPDGTGALSPMADDPTGMADDRAAKEASWTGRVVALVLVFFALVGGVVGAARHHWLPEPFNSAILESDNGPIRSHQ